MIKNLEPVMDDLLDGIKELANRGIVSKITTTSRTLYLPKALHDAGLYKQHSVEDLHEAMNRLLAKKELVANCKFDGVDGPKIMDSSRHPKSGIWYAEGSMRIEKAS
jgi:uncharacterized NAD(P)/FAD-binding protein YdhS